MTNEPRLRHKIELSEEGDQIVLDISDETGGLGLKLYLDTIVASALGQRMADRARIHAAKAVEDPERRTTETFASAAD